MSIEKILLPLQNKINNLKGKSNLHLDIGTAYNVPHSLCWLEDKNAFVIGFEPNPDNYERALREYVSPEHPRFHLLNVAVSDVEGIQFRKFNCIGPDPGTSSFYELGPKLKRLNYSIYKVVEVAVISVSSVLSNIDLSKFEKEITCKSDTQGHEISVLKSFGGYINNVKRYQVEISTYDCYNGEADTADNIHNEFKKHFTHHVADYEGNFIYTR